jgi:FtsH-binding integral membrane protein
MRKRGHFQSGPFFIGIAFLSSKLHTKLHNQWRNVMQTRDYSTASRQEPSYLDAGLRDYMLKIYNYMTIGFIITGIAALLTVSSESMMSLLYTRSPVGVVGYTFLGWIVTISPLLMVLTLSLGISRLSESTAQTLFWIFAILMGISLSSIFLLYTNASIARVFFITAAVFASMSFYGYTTKRDLTAIGSFLMMGLIGIIIASLVNLFLASSALYFATSVIGVLIFVGLTAFDTQRIKTLYANADMMAISTNRLAILGALTLYLDFINLFLLLLRFFGGERR